MRYARQIVSILLMAPFAVPFACTDVVSHLYVGSGYNVLKDCTLPEVAIDVVEDGDPGSSCNLVCLVESKSDAGMTVYTSRMCPPYPRDLKLNGDETLCAAALAARERNDVCLADGGTTNPTPVADGGVTTAEAGPSPDAGF